MTSSRASSSDTTTSCRRSPACDNGLRPVRSFASASTSSGASSTLTTSSCPRSAACDSHVLPTRSFESASTSSHPAPALLPPHTLAPPLATVVSVQTDPSSRVRHRYAPEVTSLPSRALALPFRCRPFKRFLRVEFDVI